VFATASIRAIIIAVSRLNDHKEEPSVTMTTVARRAGVSKTTVSYVLSGKRRISGEVTARVMRAIDELGYRPSSAARSLASRRTLTVGLFCNPTETLREDPYFNQLLGGALDALGPFGYQLTLYPELNDHDERPIASHAIDGALMMNPRVDSRDLQAIELARIPFVVVGTPSAPREYFCVDHDQAALIYQSAEYLVRKGHRRILFINSPRAYIGTEQRESGFAFAAREFGIELDPDLLLHAEITMEDGERVCTGALERRVEFSAVLTTNDIVAVGAIRAVRAAGRRVPHDVAVVGGGDTIIAGVHSPTLTSTVLHPYEQGKEAGAMLIEVIERRRLRPTHTILPVALVARESA
jgi:LacI family transcriptional regulator